METRFYQAQGLDIELIALELERMFIMRDYQAQHIGDKNHLMIQFKKGGNFSALVGMQKALTLTLQSTQEGVLAAIGQQKWTEKAAAGAVGMIVLWPLAFTAGTGALQQSNLVHEMLDALDAMVRQQQANVQAGPVPPHLLSLIQQQLENTHD